MMVLWEFEGKSPQIGEGTWVAPGADVIGDVIIKKNCYIGPGARVRGDYGKIRVEEGCSIQENVIIHDQICPTNIKNKIIKNKIIFVFGDLSLVQG